MKNDFYKKLPNMITGIRIIFALVLLFLEPFSPLFFIIYVFAGISDLLDGFLARKFNVINDLGATLDSIADMCFFAVVFIIVFPFLDWQLWLILAIALVLLVRLASLIVGYVKFQDFAFLHTSANKLAGFSAYCFPFLCLIAGFLYPTIYLASIALLCAIEELIINLISKKMQKNITTIFALKKEDR